MELIKYNKASNIRKRIKRDKPNCYICNKHEGITEWHHLKPLKDCAVELNNGAEKIMNRLIPLCPNCHTYFHKILYTEDKSMTQYSLLSTWGETDEIREKLIQIIRMLENQKYECNYE